jgi:hypothetical protein
MMLCGVGKVHILHINSSWHLLRTLFEFLSTHINKWRNMLYIYLISSFCLVLNVVCFLLGNSPASELYMPTFRNTVCSIFLGQQWMPRAKEIFSRTIFWHACYRFANPDLVCWAFHKELIYIIGSPGVSKISVVSTVMRSGCTYNFGFCVSPTACTDTWT